MTRLQFGPRLGDDLARIQAHLLAHDVANVPARLDEIATALAVLKDHPLIGRRGAPGRRELVIGRGSRGYVALYLYDPVDDVVAVLALRSQREAGFSDA